MGFYFLLQGIFPTQGSNLCLPLGRQILTTEPPVKPLNQLYSSIKLKNFKNVLNNKINTHFGIKFLKSSIFHDLNHAKI